MGGPVSLGIRELERGAVNVLGTARYGNPFVRIDLRGELALADTIRAIGHR